MITLMVNGQSRRMEGPVTVAEYLGSLGFDSQYVAVARNGNVLERERFTEVTLQEGDRLEVVRPVGGG